MAVLKVNVKSRRYCSGKNRTRKPLAVLLIASTQNPITSVTSASNLQKLGIEGTDNHTLREMKYYIVEPAPSFSESVILCVEAWVAAAASRGPVDAERNSV